MDGVTMNSGQKEDDPMSEMHEITLASDTTELEAFVIWLREQGHTVTVENTTGSYVDGEWTQHDEKASEIMNELWDGYCGS